MKMPMKMPKRVVLTANPQNPKSRRILSSFSSVLLHSAPFCSVLLVLWSTLEGNHTETTRKPKGNFKGISDNFRLCWLRPVAFQPWLGLQTLTVTPLMPMTPKFKNLPRWLWRKGPQLKLQPRVRHHRKARRSCWTPFHQLSFRRNHQLSFRRKWQNEKIQYGHKYVNYGWF